MNAGKHGEIEVGTTKQFTAANGTSIEVDVSEEACARFGFKPGQRIRERFYGMNGIVVGTSSMPVSSPCKDKGDEILFVQMDEIKGICFFPDPEVNFVKL